MVGSLGMFTVLYDLSKAAEMEGVQVHVVSTGERKGAAVPGTPVTDEDLAEAQRLVDGFDAFFRSAVRDGRELVVKEAAGVWTGAV
jgi:ClpP class serine protease